MTDEAHYLDIILAFLDILGDPRECMGDAAEEVMPWKNPDCRFCRCGDPA